MDSVDIELSKADETISKSDKNAHVRIKKIPLFSGIKFFAFLVRMIGFSG